MKIWAILPLKPFVRAKSRLASVLTPDQRQAISEKLFRHSLEVLTSTHQIAGVMVISRDTKALAIARDYGASTVVESGAPELNPALLRASEVARIKGAEGVLIVPADLPFFTVEDVEDMVHLGRYNAMVVIAPDRAEDGTNMMLVIPPGFIPFSYGPGSFQRHISLAQQAHATVVVHRAERLALDLDTPADWEIYQRRVGTTTLPESAVGA
jgi:2-phospho-L-lactate guanylyltransferase